MIEEDILVAMNDMLVALKEDESNTHSAPLFKKVIANSVPIWSTVESTPSVCFYLADTSYSDPDGLRYNGTSHLVVYIYNKHKTRGLSLQDILSPLISRVRAEVNKLPKYETSILNAYVQKTSRDAGTVLPYTVAELAIQIDFVEAKSCG